MSMEVTKCDTQWERDNCECENCRCAQNNCKHEGHQNMDKDLDLTKVESMDGGKGDVMWSGGYDWEQWEYGDVSEAEQWDQWEHDGVNEYTGMMESVRKVRKVRCDQDDVNGVALRDVCTDAELEKWLEPLVIDEKMDLPENGICIGEEKSTSGESVDALMAAAAPVDGSIGMFVDASMDALMAAVAPIDNSVGTCVDKSTDAS